MTRLTPRGHTEADREKLTSVTGRVPLELVRDRHHEWQDSMAEWAVDNPPQCHGISCNQGRKPCRDRCGAEMACDDHAAAARRPEPRTPHLPLWTRLKLWWTSFSAGWGK